MGKWKGGGLIDLLSLNDADPASRVDDGVEFGDPMVCRRRVGVNARPAKDRDVKSGIDSSNGAMDQWMGACTGERRC